MHSPFYLFIDRFICGRSCSVTIFVIIKIHWLPTSPYFLLSNTHTLSITRTHTHTHTHNHLRALNSTLEEERIKLQTDLTAVRSELKRKTSDKIPDKGPESATKRVPLEEESSDSEGLLVRTTISLISQRHNP